MKLILLDSREGAGSHGKFDVGALRGRLQSAEARCKEQRKLVEEAARCSHWGDNMQSHRDLKVERVIVGGRGGHGE